MTALDEYRRDLRLVRRGPVRNRWEHPIAPWERAEALERCLRVALPYCAVQVEVENLPGMSFYTATAELSLSVGPTLHVQHRASELFLCEAKAPIVWIAREIAQVLARLLVKETEPP